MPVIKQPALVQTIPEPQSNVAGSLAKIKASMPENLMIYFKFNDSKFKADSRTDSDVKTIKAWLDKYPASVLSVTGHTDLVGTPEYNHKLGMKRAQNAAKYLESIGIGDGKMVIYSKGATEPVADYLTAEGRSKNRNINKNEIG